jgi:hypothetical protein
LASQAGGLKIVGLASQVKGSSKTSLAWLVSHMLLA